MVKKVTVKNNNNYLYSRNICVQTCSNGKLIPDYNCPNKDSSCQPNYKCIISPNTTDATPYTKTVEECEDGSTPNKVFGFKLCSNRKKLIKNNKTFYKCTNNTLINVILKLNLLELVKN